VIEETMEGLLRPIPGENPAGEDLRYTSVYDGVKAARQGDPANQVNPDWSKVEKETAQGLQERSKDLQLAVWLLEALTRKYGFSGAADGLRYLAGLIEAYWDCFYPQIDPEDEEPLAFRTAVLLWVADRFPAVLKSLPLTAEGYTLLHYEVTQKTGEEKQALLEDGWPSFEQLDESMLALPYEHWDLLTQDLEKCQEALAQLEAVTSERFVEKVPGASGTEREERLISFHQVKEALETSHWLAKRAARKKAEGLEISESQATSKVPVAAAVEDKKEPLIKSRSDLPEERKTTPSEPRAVSRPVQPGSPEEAFRTISRLAAFLREDNPYRPIPYLLTRAIAWGQLFGFEVLSEANLSAPAGGMSSRLRELWQREEWWELLQECENALEDQANWPWLDLHRYSLEALQNLGYERAALAVHTFLAGLLQTHPGLLGLELADGTPSASSETREWIEEHVLLEAGAAPGVLEEIGEVLYEQEMMPYPEASPNVGMDVDTGITLWEQAVARLEGRDFAGGLGLLQQQAGAASSGRERFLRKLELAEYCLLAGRQNLSFPILDELVRAIDEFHLEQWEDKNLIARAWSGFVRCCRKPSDRSEEKKRRAEEIFGRLCRLDVTKALSVEKE
jgi:type VI secretion system protein ImpA